MDKPQIIIRPAQKSDATFIAKAVAMAIGDVVTLRNYCGDDYITTLTEIARRDNTQYSWRFGLIAEIDGVAAGAIVGYAGASLKTLRDGTYAVIKAQTGHTPTLLDETEAGEFYLDSVGVLPEIRGLGIGRALVTAFCEKVFTEGHERVGLIVDYNNPGAEKLYTSLGFERVGTRIFFGHKMCHLQKRNNLSIYERVLHARHITEFQRRVYLELLHIPAGETITYGELAHRIGCRSAQAVGQALRRNPFAPDVPCHRVVAADGSLCGYKGKRDDEMLEQKRELLEKEIAQNSYGNH